MKFVVPFPAVRPGALLAMAGSLLMLASCSLENRLERRNDAYTGLQDRREMRQDARQERTDAWFDRVMH